MIRARRIVPARRLIPIGCRGRFVSILVERRKIDPFDRARRWARRGRLRTSVVWFGDQAIDLEEVFA